MKHCIYLLLSLCIYLSCQEKDKKSDVSNTPVPNAQYRFHVKGMSCQTGCATYIQEQINQSQGVSNSYVNFKDSLVTVYYDSTLTRQKKIRRLFPMLEGKYVLLPEKE